MSTYSADNYPKHLTRWAAALVRHPTDPVHVALVIRVVVAGVPAPLGDCAPVLDIDSSGGRWAGEQHCLAVYMSTELDLLHIFIEFVFLIMIGKAACRDRKRSSATRIDHMMIPRGNSTHMQAAHSHDSCGWSQIFISTHCGK